MSNLKKYRFCDLYTMSSGISSTKDQAGHGSPFLSFSVVFNNYFVPDALTDLMATSDKEKDTYSIKSGDIFLTRTSEVVDELAMSCVAIKDYPKASYSGFLKRLRPTQTDITYSKFMAFYLRSPMFRKTMTNNAVMTLRASLNEAIFSYLDLLLPEYDDQVKAGDLLYLLNEKIELNNRINAELEAMAKTLYDYWFVQFDYPDVNGKPYKTSGGKMVYNRTLKREIPEGWSDGTLGEIAELYQPKTISEKEMIEDGEFLVYGANGIVGRYDEYNHEQSVVAVTCRGNSCGEINVTRPFSWITGNAMVVKTDSHFLPPTYIYNLLRSAGLENVITGSAQPQITRTNLAPMKIIRPAEKVLTNYAGFVKPHFKKRIAILDENEKLEKLRDWLLPILMNGQVTVK
ncbi:restriction endonuclease subunit S [Vibrio sp. TH_r3]|uniref:restriction endonuclease subunit S n=1 Tax=Vibrio sp. TH_r3 TaxID=3082084 RepID=UPI002953C6F6|nr:restriction endonuclease subunit S [Vibrio sp. TH_r3]MDV7105394.1 restriction endonuclease subunit S [Vibrio sp. TH_r3]